MAPSSSSSATTTSVQVALRIRPPTAQDSTSIPARFQRSVIQTTSSTSISIEAPLNVGSGSGATVGPSAASSSSSARRQAFTFDQVHPPPTSQYELFTSTAKPLVSRFIEGFNCTILAYGQTSSGKTFTMTGIDLDADPSDPNNRMGIIPRAVSTIFSTAKQLKEERAGAWNYSIKGSFIEIYNEDLIDLLNMDDASGGRREVQIREDKDGHIIWGGLREVGVRNTAEVMSLIRKGTAIRRTNETDMNAQSSRSHAIFSLTLTQKKYKGSGPPPRSPSPLPPGGRSPSRLARPGSMYAGPNAGGANRVSSPTFGRPTTPSFASAMSRGGLRPSSALGHASERAFAAGEEEGGEWVTIVSKFHFVDLAGSERLKRTAAAGERIKEGISINSGLLALGNVISALGDPSRAKTATHIPYRDSKLTRLLQDSLGGNAHTLMIACVSPAEWNAAETINTLKYANRARNIKNRAVLNEREEGWDDIEWLQGTVTRLRKDLKQLKEGGAVAPSSVSHPEVHEGASKRVLAQLTELQNNYEDLREKFVERTEELTRLRRELGEKHRSSTSGAIGGTAKYEEIVGPVIEEYEKTIAAMEAELSLNRAALRHTNDLVEEKEEEVSVLTERHSATELYVEELRSRVAKLTEREASTEAYVRDLEEKIKAYDESSVTSSESMTDLKREVSRYKDAESSSAKYIADLEARLARSDESVLSLQQTIENLESECDRRRDEVGALQARLESLRKDGESWRTELEERERRVKHLEDKKLEWEKRMNDAAETRTRLGSVVGEVVSARRSLELDIAKASVPGDSDATPSSTPNSSPVDGEPISRQGDYSSHSMSLGEQLIALQQTHTATLADLSSVTAKYRDALREISELAAQIQEAKLSSSSMAEASYAESPSVDKPIEIPTHRRRLTGGRLVDSQYNSSGRRLFFRQAASAESLHSRSLSQSQSLSQELSSVHLRKTSFSSHTSSSHSPSSSHSLPAPTLKHAGSRSNLSISLPVSGISAHERSVASLEKEIMRLQEVLKEREAEISALETSLKETQAEKSIATSEPDAAAHVNGAVSLEVTLSPKTLDQFDHIKKSMENGHTHEVGSERNGSSVISETDESLERLNELMLSMAQKESHHREVVDDLNSQLSQVRRQLDELTTLSRNQALNMSTELEGLQGRHEDTLAALRDAETRETELVQSLNDIKASHAIEVEKLRSAHEAALGLKAAEMDQIVSQLKAEHDAATSTLHNELEATKKAVGDMRSAHEEAFGKLKKEHEEELQRQMKDAEAVLARTREEQERSLNRLRSDHEETLKQKDAEANAVLQRTEEEYYNALTKLRGDHAEAIKKLTQETNATIDRLREDHAGELRMAEIHRQGALSESESAQTAALKELQDEHAAAIVRKEASFTEEMENLKAEHERILAMKLDDYTLQMDKQRLEYETQLAKFREERRIEVDRLASALSVAKEEHSSLSTKAKADLESALKEAKEQHALILEEVARGHEEELARLKSLHENHLKESFAEAEQRRSALARSHEEELSSLRAEHNEAISALDTSLVASQEKHRLDEEESERRTKRLLAEERDRAAATLRELQTKQSTQLGDLYKDQESLRQEVYSYKVAAEEYTAVQERTRSMHERAMAEKDQMLKAVQSDLTNVCDKRDQLNAEVVKLREELENTRSEQTKLIQEASKRESLVTELEHHRSVLAEIQENLQKVKDEKDTLQVEKNRADSLVRDLQAQIARSASPPNARPVAERSVSYSRANGLSVKLPPPAPPPSVPPPPAPKSATSHVNGESIASSQASPTFISSRDSQSELSPTSTTSTSVGPHSVAAMDPKFAVKLEQQAKQIDEQEAMIKTLNKQLTHCESDLQTHMDLVNTLETSLGESEKNLRKARMHATELARERDTLNAKTEALRNELAEAKREVLTVRRSIVEEKQSLEQRLDEERKAKERARQQLDARMEELQKRKSKFACL